MNTRNKLVMFSPMLIIIIFISGVVPESPLTVEIEQGALQGTYLTSANGRKFMAFQGIPYARPPTGKYRFKDPAPPKPWVGIWNASLPGSKCLQYKEIPTYASHIYEPVQGDEDCLFINVYTTKLPSKGTNDKLLDVIVYIHGGAFMHGQGTQYGPKLIMDRDVVYVTFNYRLGPLGFLTTEDEVVPGNMGLKDQSQALRWVQKNVAAFGGNPNSVTLTGNSAGGASVHYHYLSPLSQGLFHRGFSQSGSALCPWTQMEGGLQKAKKLASFLGCSTISSKEMVKCMRKRPAYQIVQQIKNFKVWLHSPFTPFGPTIEKAGSAPFLNEHPNDIILKGKAHNLPWIASVDKEEGLYPVADFIANEELLRELEERFNELAPHLLDYNYTATEEKKPEVISRVRNFYFKDKPISKKTIPELIQMASDRLFVMDTVRAAQMHAATYSEPVYFYLFAYRGNHSLSEFMSGTTTNYGVSHADDTGYTIDCEFIDVGKTEDDRNMSKFMLDIWTSYANTGNPAPKERNFKWDPISNNAKDFRYLYINNINDAEMKSSDNLGNRKFWDSLPIAENQLNVDELTYKKHNEL